ncbi:uncharacterized protein row isoform X3 [Procambarus clarkii]|uniref:uncharacterized protein row isoform X3 n=1 Tax=Procambarus clarkii TaxID=6728 RepID=UPI001E671BBF|nr:uncharacterized protein LOC123764285 isoform X3 [Procambarus clarkii]
MGLIYEHHRSWGLIEMLLADAKLVISWHKCIVVVVLFSWAERGGCRVGAWVSAEAEPGPGESCPMENCSLDAPEVFKPGSTSSSQNGPGLLLECESEGLSDAQTSKIQKLQDDLRKIQFILRNGNTQVGLQVPQFLLLQNGQMIAAASTLPSNGQTTTPAPTSTSPTLSQASSVYSSTDLAKKPKTPTVHSTPANSTPVSTRTTRSSANANKNNVPTRSSSPDIQVLREMRISPQTTSPTQPTSTVTSSSNTTTNNNNSGVNKFMPLLNVVARPKNTLPPAVAMNQRKELDAKVKSVLVKSAQEFVEWLLGEGMIRTSQYCTAHKIQPTMTPVKLKLGMFSDPKVLSTSGGYVWISECCGKKYVSVYSGSIFGSTPIDKVPPTSVLKLVYHWACQTSVSNVESWVKVEKSFINKMFQYMRCICSVMLQDKVYDFGFDGTTVELGIVSLGTSTADGTKKAVKVEILGLYDRKMKSYRLFASEPEPGSSSRQRFVRILKPLERVVHTNAIILCDQSVDRNCLYNMNYGKVSVCETSDNEENLQSNARIMSYLRRHVPKMFQSALSQLNLQQVQVVLDELCWRERYGHCAAQAYVNMIDHITYLTTREAENPGVLHLLDFVSQKPQHNWRYKSQHVPKGTLSLQPSIIMTTPTAGSITPQLALDSTTLKQTPMEHTNKVALAPRRIQASSLGVPASKVPVATMSPKADVIELEPFYYGQIQGDATLGRELNLHTFTCHICNEVYDSNLEFYTHLKFHLGRSSTPKNKFCCSYCTEHLETEEARNYHHKFKHMQMDQRFTWCRICSESFTGEYPLVNHMAKKHYESELPYRCEVCHFSTSIYFSVIDHFNKEHKDTPYVQCHYCLNVKFITATSASTFSQRMFQHLQKHASQQGKCKFCVLSFYSKYLLEEHKKKDHASCAQVRGLQRYKVPAGQNRIMFRPWVKRLSATNNTSSTYNATNRQNSLVAISSTIEVMTNVTITLDTEDQSYYCLECDASLSLENHFRAYQRCTKCTYATCCRSMISKHSQVFHPTGRSKRGYYNIGPPIILPKPMFCICGFSTRSGNHLARHLSMCEGGRKSAYPSMSDAMVYNGDPITVDALSLANLGLSNIAISGILPETTLVSTMPDAQTTRDQTLDMTHFMSMSMEIDEEG